MGWYTLACCVRGTTSARFSILYTLDDGPIALQQGQATAFLTAAAGEALTFTYTLDVPAELTISVTPTSGEHARLPTHRVFRALCSR